MDTSPELVNPTGKFEIGSVEAELALNYAGADQGHPDITFHLLLCTSILHPQKESEASLYLMSLWNKTVDVSNVATGLLANYWILSETNK